MKNYDKIADEIKKGAEEYAERLNNTSEDIAKLVMEIIDLECQSTPQINKKISAIIQRFAAKNAA